MLISRRSDRANVDRDDVTRRDGIWKGGRSENGIEGYATTMDDEDLEFSLLLDKRGSNCWAVSTDEMRRVLRVSTTSLGASVKNGPMG